MSLVSLQPFLWSVRGLASTITTATLNAAGESYAVIGQIHLVGQTGSKTISSAGGTLYWNSDTAQTFANGGTNLRIGLQDVTAGGVEDGTFDVQADLVGGVDPIAASSLIATPMESGSKTVTHGDLVAIVIEMTARAGADSVTVDGLQHTLLGGDGLPYGTEDTGGGPTKINSFPVFFIKFDDGTYGWISTIPRLFNSVVASSVITFNSGSALDEYAGIFQVPVPMTLAGIGALIGSVATGDAFELILYSDPEGSPVAERTWIPDPDQLRSGGVQIPTIAPFDLLAATSYAIALRPTTAGDITWSYKDLTTGFDLLKAAQPFSSIKMAARANQTGAFAETQVYHLPEILLNIVGLDDGTGGGGGDRSYVGA